MKKIIKKIIVWLLIIALVGGILMSVLFLFI